MQATAKTSQIFLGMEVQCTQCHNHPFNEYKQNQFWELNAFFRQTRARAAGRTARREMPVQLLTAISPARGAMRRRRREFSTSCATALVQGGVSGVCGRDGDQSTAACSAR